MAGEFSGTIQQAFGKAESSYDTAVAISATDAVDGRLEITPDKGYEEILASSGSGTYEGEIDSATGGKWTFTCDMQPTSAGTAPDIGFALKAAMGTETVSGGTSVTYSFNDTSAESLTWTKYAGSSFYERINGAWVENVTIEGAKGGLPKFTFSGGFASYGYLHGNPTVNGVNATSATTINVTAGHGYLIGVGAYIAFGSDSNTSAGYRVTSVTSSTVTITPGLTGAGTSGGEAITPVVPSRTIVGTRIGGVSHGLTIDGTAVSPISMKYTLSTGLLVMDKESSSAKPTGIIRGGTRPIVLDVDAYFKHASMPFFSAAHYSSQVLRDFAARYGADTAAARVKVNTDKVNVRVQGVPVQDGEITMIKYTGRARKNAAANDEFSLVFD